MKKHKIYKMETMSPMAKSKTENYLPLSLRSFLITIKKVEVFTWLISKTKKSSWRNTWSGLKHKQLQDLDQRGLVLIHSNQLKWKQEKTHCMPIFLINWAVQIFLDLQPIMFGFQILEDIMLKWIEYNQHLVDIQLVSGITKTS